MSLGSRLQGGKGIAGTQKMPGKQFCLPDCGNLPDCIAIQHPFPCEKICSL